MELWGTEVLRISLALLKVSEEGNWLNGRGELMENVKKGENVVVDP